MAYLICSLNNESITTDQNYLELIQHHFPFTVEIPDDLNQNEINELSIFFSNVKRDYLKRNISFEKVALTNIEDNFCFNISNDNPPNTNPLQLSNYFRYNNWVKIRQETFDDYLRIPISNFVGKIIDFYNNGEKDVFYIQWNHQSLSQISEKNIHKCINNKISPFGSYISNDMVLPIYFSETPFLVEEKQMELLKPYFIKKFEVEYNSVFGKKNTDDFSYQIWEHFFDNLLQNEHEIHLIKNRSEFRVISISGSDEKNGVWVEVTNANKKFVIPLNSFKKIKTSLTIENYFAFYKFWSIFFSRD